MKKLQKYIATLEHKIDTVFPNNFVEELTKLVNAYDGKQQGSITIEVTPFQADPDISRRVICGEADVIVSGDSDFAMYIGPASSDIMIRLPKLDLNSLMLKSAILVTSQDAVCFAKSDQQFKKDQLLHSACVARVRSGNERAVKIAKTSKIIGNGIPNNTFDLCLLDDIWMAWGFQVNFMYDPIL